MTLAQAWRALFTPAEARLLGDAGWASVAISSRQQILRAGVADQDMLYLSRGFAGRYRCDRLRRQFLGIQVPGDFLDLPGFFLGPSGTDAEALGPVEAQAIPARRLQALEAEAPVAIDKLRRIALIDAAIRRRWVYRRAPRRPRPDRQFFCEMLLRLYTRGLCSFGGFALPLTQVDLAEANGMPPVHVNRMLSELRQGGVCTFSQGGVSIAKLPDLFQAARYRWDYLCLGADLDREIRDRIGAGRTPAARARPEGKPAAIP